MAPLTVKADLKHPTYVYTGGESDFKILIMVLTIQWNVDNSEWSNSSSPFLPRPRKTTIKQLRLERDGYSFTISNLCYSLEKGKVI